MPLAPGTQLGPCQITSLIGKGGMGEVYRARDTTLKRDVALKVLPSSLSTDPDRIARFQREAEVLAQLDHPNIAPIFGMIESDGQRALALALVEGPTLADHIAAGPMPREEALAIAKQIIEALEYAHDRGVVHRDLKPSNIKINPDGVVKVLDFGLAKVLEDEPPKSAVGTSPTLTLGHTRAGMILGTAAYMSPEQAIGRPVDRRSDIFSFGAVLYEMLTGERAFAGATTPDVLEAVVKTDPDWSKLPPQAPEQLLRRCLVKDRKQRLQAVGEARIALESPPTELRPGGAAPHIISRLWPATAAVLAIALASVSWIAYRATQPSDKPLARLNLDLPSSDFALSPDGVRIAYVQPGTTGPPMLATRLLADSSATILRGTENAQRPFFSPDGQWIGFYANNQLLKLAVQGGAPVPLAPAVTLQGATWGKDGSIIAVLDNASHLSRVPDTGGAPEEVVSRAEPGSASGLYSPQYLPGGHSVLFTVFGNAPGLYVKNLVTRKTQRLLANIPYARYLPTGQSTGHLVYVSQGTLFARPFDPAKLVLLGPPQPVLSDVATDLNGPLVSFSETGSFLYQMGQSEKPTWPVQWMDSSGSTRPLLNTQGSYQAPQFSPDPAGQYLALVKSDTMRGQVLGEVLVYDWKNDVTITLTRPGKLSGGPAWSPDGHHLAMSNSQGIAWVRSDGSGEPRQILEWKNPISFSSISPDGRHLAFSEFSPETSLDVWVAPLDLSKPDQPVVGKPEPFVQSRRNDVFPQFSPDGKWLAYFSDESGRYEIYVRPFPGPGTPHNVSVDGGIYPAWSSSGHELFFEVFGRGIMVVDYHVSGDAFIAARPRVWSHAPIRRAATQPSWALHPDGKRIAMFPPETAAPDTASQPRFGFLLNFFDEVRRRAPTN